MSMESQMHSPAMQNQPKHSSVRMLHMFSDSKHPILDLFGPTVQFFTTSKEADGQLCVMKGVIPNGAIVPIATRTWNASLCSPDNRRSFRKWTESLAGCSANQATSFRFRVGQNTPL